MNKKDVKRIIRDTLTGIQMWSREAEAIMMGTAAVESGFHYWRQIGGGPAFSFWQVEPATALDNMENYLKFRKDKYQRIAKHCVLPSSIIYGKMDVNMMAKMLHNNIGFACAMARIKYWRVPKPLPDVTDIIGQSKYWKKYYNSDSGKGTPGKYAEAWEKHEIHRFL